MNNFKTRHFYKLLTIVSLVYVLSNQEVMAQPYCTTNLYYYGCTYNGALEDFQLAGISHSATGCGPSEYTDFTALTCTLAKAETYAFSFTTNTPSYYSQYDHVGLWIDFNDDGDFDDADEWLYSTSGGQYSGLLSIPAGVSSGLHRLRVRSIVTQFPLQATNSCTVDYEGEVHDYSVMITAALPCSNVSLLNITNTLMNSADVSWTCNSCTGPFYVEYGPTGFIPGTTSSAGVNGTVSNTMLTAVSLTGLQSGTDYQVYVRRDCSMDGFSNNTGPYNFTTLYDACGTNSTLNCGVPVTSVMTSGAGAFNFQCGQFSDTPGREIMYSFSPAVSGTYTFTIISGNAKFAYKDVTSGCSGTGWTCIDTYSPGTYILGALSAGNTYYILIDNPSTSAGSVNFMVDCYIPHLPCQAITTISCGQTVTSVIGSGIGSMDSECGPNSNFYGKENIYSFTPQATGTYTITVSDGYSYFGYKEASDGCSGTGWSCLNVFGPGTYLIGMLNANTEYYFFNDVSDISGTQTSFMLDCFAPYFPCQAITTIGCSLPVSLNIAPGLGAFSNTQCQYYQNTGKEVIYSFTPQVSGNYTLSILQSYDYNTVGFSYKNANSGCDENSWNCIIETSFNETFLLGYMSANTQYYLLADAYSFAGAIMDFQIDCVVPSLPCAAPVTVDCGVPIIVSVAPGAGSFYIPGCSSPGDLPIGKEQIFQFTPSSNGVAALHLTDLNYSSGAVKYYYKDVSGGCSSTGWTCLGQFPYASSYLMFPVPLSTSSSYYILADVSNLGGKTQEFEIICPEDYDPCANISPLACSTQVTAIFSPGLGPYDLQCQGYSNYFRGKQKIYSFTPSVSGTHTIDLDPNTQDYVNYYIKNASSGCNDAGWNCIPMYYSSNPTPYPLMAGTTYYILLEPQGVTGAIKTFSIECPSGADPCQSLLPANCGSSYSVSNGPGLGMFDPQVNNFFQFTGKETIYQFTPTVSGNYLVNITNVLSPYSYFPGYFIKEASDGCNNDNWSYLGAALDDVSFTVPISLTAGTSYYLMIDGESDGQDWELVCPVVEYDPCPSISLISGCGTLINGVRSPGLGAFSPDANCNDNQEPGKENIYEFTAPVSGNYSLALYATSGFDLYFIKDAASGCTTNGWQCIQNGIFPFNLVAGTNYLILVDGGDFNGSSYTFAITCPEPDPCWLAIPSLTCGTYGNTAVIPPGAGSYNLGNCNSYYEPVGREHIFQVTPVISGVYYFSASNIQSQKVYFYIKDAAGGCNMNGWSCITSSFGSYVNPEALPFSLIAGNTYYIMSDNSDIGATSADISLTCASGCELYADKDGDGYGDPNDVAYSCFPVLGYIPDNSDCDDGNENVHPGAIEICGNSIDDDCNGQVDDACCDIAMAINATHLVCSGYSTGQAALTVTGATAPVTYSWSTSPAQTVQTATGLAAGTYSVLVTDANGCTATESVMIAEPPAMIISSTITHVKCNGQINGSISVSASNTQPPYSYLWNNGSTNVSRTNLGANSYTVTVTDGNLCTKSAVITVVQPAALIVTGVITNITCNGAANGTATANPAGGTGPYTYSWNTVPARTTQTITGLAPGVYACTVKDANNCLKTLSCSVTQPSVLNVSVSKTATSATANPTGGVAAYSYLWSNSKTTKTITGLTPGTYTVTVMDARGCTKSGSAAILPLKIGMTDGEPVTVNLYPNPTDGMVFLDAKAIGDTQAELLIYDMHGRLIRAERINLAKGINHFEADLTSYPAGLYLLRFNEGTESKVFKIIRH